MKVLLSALTLFLSFSVYSGYEGGDRTVSSIRFAEGYLKIRFSPAPAACLGGDDYRMHAYIDQTSENKEEMISALLAAYAADMIISVIWFDDGVTCAADSSLKLKAFEFKNK